MVQNHFLCTSRHIINVG